MRIGNKEDLYLVIQVRNELNNEPIELDDTLTNYELYLNGEQIAISGQAYNSVEDDFISVDDGELMVVIRNARLNDGDNCVEIYSKSISGNGLRIQLLDQTIYKGECDE